MSIKVICSCGKEYNVKDELAGKTAKCKVCGADVFIPNPPKADAAELSHVAPAKNPSAARPAKPAPKPSPGKVSPAKAKAVSPHSRKVLFASGGLVVLLVTGVILFFALRDTWERDHRDEIIRLSGQINELVKADDLAGATAQHEKLQALLSGHTLKDTVTQQTVSSAKEGVDSLRLKKKQEEEERRLAAEQKKRVEELLETLMKDCPDDKNELQEIKTNGCNINTSNSTGSTMLHYAVFHANDLEIVSALIKAGADVNIKNKGGFTPLHYAKSSSIANALIKAGADVNAKDKDGASPLYSATINNVSSVVNALIQAGADVNAKDDIGTSPLHFAVLNNSSSIVHSLVKAGANANAKNGDGVTPLDIAKSKKFSSIVNALVKTGVE